MVELIIGRTLRDIEPGSIDGIEPGLCHVGSSQFGPPILNIFRDGDGEGGGAGLGRVGEGGGRRGNLPLASVGSRVLGRR